MSVGAVLVVLEQVLWAFSGLFLSVLLFRSTGRADYALFVTLTAAATLFQTLHNTFVIEPMLIEFSDRPQEFDFISALVFSVFSWILFSFVVAMVYPDCFENKTIFLEFSLVGWAVPLFWMYRRYQMMSGDGATSVVTTFCFCAIIILSSFVAYLIGFLDAALALFVNYVSAIVCAGTGLYFGRKKLKAKTRWSSVVCLVKEGWRIAPSSLCMWVQSGFVFLAMPFFSSPVAQAMFRAEYNMVLPVAQFNSTLSTYLLNAFSLNRSRGVLAGFGSAKGLLAAVFFVNFLYSMAVIFFGDIVFRFVYSYPLRSPFAISVLIVLCNFFMLFIFIFGAILKGAGVVQDMPVVGWVSNFLMVVASLLVLKSGGLYSPYLAMIVNCVVLFCLYFFAFFVSHQAKK
ncbi:lipopolysaccharide biosynthesis protein [Uliginosibacterium sp. TH139]|uniref:lipopolysaccharide biosynthesis protein n=1 Tax=Uliginosibacterium sp. TH139 TaxID=2067453 RepID=UPI000C7B1DBD|nr:hypothetical protein [Uliginosibacterium sp. TH139]PLK50058.1 hypothetical protein C0V76_06535 [Uliginosibacterium sp. TH139]